MTRRRVTRSMLPAGILSVVALVAGCTIGPSTRPPLATSGAIGSVRQPTSTAAAMPTGPGGSGRSSDPIAWSDCNQQIPRQNPTGGPAFTLACAQVQVPKSYGAGSAGTFSVSIARAKTAAAPASAPPLLVVVGDAGQNGTHQIASVAGALPTAILAHYAIVVMDIRGTGDSVPIDCVSGTNSSDLLSLGADPTTPVASRVLAGISRSLTFDCGDMVGPDLSSYSTVPAADDIDTVRAALGVRRLAILGRGFGATLGAVYADRYPGRVAAVVLDGPSDPSLTSDKQAVAVAVAVERALASFAAACPTFSGGCPLGSDPVAAVRALVAATGDIGVPGSDGREITGGSVLLMLTGQLGNPAGWPALAIALAAARKGDYQQLTTLLVAPLGSQNASRRQAGALVYRCNDSARRLGGTDLAAAAGTARTTAPLFGPFLIGLIGICSSWPAPENALGPVTATGAAPILVLGAVDDPVSPFGEVRSLTAQLGSATLLTWQSGTHGAYPQSACMTSAVNAYLLAGTMPAGGTLCPP